jgi:ATP-binding cassette subfamily B protein
MVELLKTPHGIEDALGAKLLSVTEGAIAFTDVDFYFHETRSVLEKFSLSIKPGEKVALVGPSGAGKTTITKLILRLYDVAGGTITIDDQDIARVTQESLRDAIAFVPQEPTLFHRSIMDNIRYGRREATSEEVVEAAKQAHCHEFITTLPQGYETFVGERGVKLSGGERQRVAIARALLKNAPILVLDEATSSLDSESESLIQDALKTLMKNKTVIVIAHRLSTVMSMDRIIVIDGGSIADQGTHAELLAKDGIYQKLWSIQAGGFLGGLAEESETT